MGIDDAQAIQVQRHDLGVGVLRYDVEPHGRLIATARKEQIADLRRALKHRQILWRDRRRDAGRRLRLPCLAGSIDEVQEVLVEVFVERSAGRKQSGEVVERDVLDRSSGERVAAGNRRLAQQGRPAWCAVVLLRGVQRAHAAQLVAADRHCLQPAPHRLRVLTGLGLQVLRRVVAAPSSGRAARRRSRQTCKLHLQVVQQLQRVVDRRPRWLADERDQRGVAIFDRFAGRFRRRTVGLLEQPLKFAAPEPAACDAAAAALWAAP